MSRNLSQITNQNTFGVWKTRTNDIISVIGSVVTIGDSETNTGNIVIDGNVSASGTLFIDTIQETSGNGNNLITINSDLGVEGDIIMDQSSGATTLTYSLANTPTWTIGTSADHTTLDIKKGTTYLRITDGGSLTGANLTIDADLFPTSGDPIALDTTGNAATATAWASGRTISLTGDVTATSTAFDGSSDLSFAVTVEDDSHNHTIANVDNLQAGLDAKAALAGANFTGGINLLYTQEMTFGVDTSSSPTDRGHGYIKYGGNIAGSPRIFTIGLEDGTNPNNQPVAMYIELQGKSLAITNNDVAKTSFSSANGNIVTVGDITAFGTVSDRNRKENIVKIENALDKVSQISGYTFNYLGDDTPMTGVIAQELEEVLPEVVYETEMPDGTQSKAVRHGNIVGLLIESIKELKAEIEELKKEK
jgi:hypothetical protein